MLALVLTAALAMPDLAQVERQVVSRTNAFRESHGRGAVRAEPRLDRVAQAFADHLARTDRFEHDADGSRPADRVRRAGYRWCFVAENIAYQQRSIEFTVSELARELVQGWEESPGHRRNMLAAEAHDTGVGIARSRKTGRYYAVQVFGRQCGR